MVSKGANGYKICPIEKMKVRGNILVHLMMLKRVQTKKL